MVAAGNIIKVVNFIVDTVITLLIFFSPHVSVSGRTVFEEPHTMIADMSVLPYNSQSLSSVSQCYVSRCVKDITVIFPRRFSFS